MTNFTSAHESRTGFLGARRLAYPADHVEADNRLSWLLGRLDEAYGDEAFYVHLRRDADATAASFVKRYRKGIMRAYTRRGILHGLPRDADRLEVARDYCLTVGSNIEHFLRDKTHTLAMDIETPLEAFELLWDRIGAEGDFEAGARELGIRHNAS
ncbi:MAG: hypothetical protein QF903_04675 [Planctomycetota bacterium]|jgi:hypothetical protein|nr:hypothetical protein [Planctomycetota bacterium]MDP6763566.1 hypothetical protein [Planctomycetota bacterium]MDP6988752.1 hypothetical protein [Planctomycetota bacterium]